jgi:two-component system response regulator YesN
MLRILLVDDNEFERDGIKFLLKKNNIEVSITEAMDGREALNLLKRQYFQLLITDIKMPFMDGVELVKNLRSFNCQTKILIISGYDEFKYAKELLKYDVIDYLIKPINFNQLVEIVQTALKISEIADHQECNRMQEITAVIQEEFQSNLTLDELANRFFLHPSYLSKLFKEASGINFIKYLNDVRLQHAIALLENSHMKIAQIAAFVGIPNTSYFNRIFKSEFGVTPSDYRKGVRKND